MGTRRRADTSNPGALHSGRAPKRVSYIGAPLRVNYSTPSPTSGDQRVDAEVAAYVGNLRNIIHHRTTCRPSLGRAFIGRPPPNTRQPLDDSEMEECSRRKAAIIGLPLPSTSETQFRVPLEGEILETAELEVPGEDNAGGTTGDDVHDVDMPVRVLTDFTVFQQPSGKFIPFESLLGLDSDSLASRDYSAAGHVLTWIEEDDSASSENTESDFGRDGQIPVVLSGILDVSIHYVEDARPRHFSLDPKLYIRTVHAWYILYVPSPEYHQFFAPMWIKARLFHQVITSLQEDRRISYRDFLGALPESEASEAAEDILGRRLTKADFESDETVAYIIATFADLAEQEDLYFLSDFLHGKLLNTLQAASISTPRCSVTTKSVTTLPSIERTVVTPWVYSIAKEVFLEAQLECCGPDPVSRASPALPPVDHACHVGAIQHITWIEGSELDAPGHFSAAMLDGVRYDVGDCIMLETGMDDNLKRQKNAIAKHSRSHNPLANSKWFARICYFFEVKGAKMFHGQWFQHGAQILLQELAHPQGLFLIDECEDLPVDVIYQKANVQELQLTEDEPAYTPAYCNNFFTGVMWDQSKSVFFQRSASQVQAALDVCEPGQPCVACGTKVLQQQEALWTVNLDYISHGKIPYHCHDFVYIRPEDTASRLYIIGQILAFGMEGAGPLTVDVMIYAHSNEQKQAQHESSFDVNNERHLFCTEMVLKKVSVDRIEGKPFVLHLNTLCKKAFADWLDYDDHFVCDSSTDFVYCKRCLKLECNTLSSQHQDIADHAKLRGLELFAGAGGLSAGLEQADFVQTQWAIEWSPSAACTYQANHPHAIVYNQSVNACLKHAILTSEGKNPPSLLSRGRHPKQLPPMPKPGEVDFVYGGPPCQGYSGMNHTKTPQDIRNTLVADMISYVDFYRPKFFLLENVRGILEWKGHTALAGDEYDAQIEMAAPKFIARAMISLGYQIHFRILDAGNYGAPQRRNRVIFLGARRDIPLPMFPIPTHIVPKDVYKRKLPTGDILYPVVRHQSLDTDQDDWHTHIQFAPHLFVTVEDAISDLPKFDWDDPHEIISQTSQAIRQRKHRAKLGIPCEIAVNIHDDTDLCGFVQGAEYALPPQNRYQQWMRSRCGEIVMYHYTAKYGSKLVERTVNIPLQAGANHDSLPPALRLSHRMLKSDGTSKNAYTSLFQRIDGKGLFSTALTTVSPNNKGGTVLHPNQKRVVTVREGARAQGFPDHWKFLSELKSSKLMVLDQYRQIGNAVPVPLAFALGKEICKAVLIMWKEEDQRDEREREESPELDLN